MADITKTVEVKTPVKEIVYSGEFRILNKHAAPIKWDGKVYSPKDADEVAELEYHVKVGHIRKI